MERIFGFGDVPPAAQASQLLPQIAPGEEARNVAGTDPLQGDAQLPQISQVQPPARPGSNTISSGASYQQPQPDSSFFGHRSFGNLDETSLSALEERFGFSRAEMNELYTEAVAENYGLENIAMDPTTGKPIAYQVEGGEWLNAAESGSVFEPLVDKNTGETLGYNMNGKFISLEDVGGKKVPLKERMAILAQKQGFDTALQGIEDAFSIVDDPSMSVVGPVAGSWMGEKWDNLMAIAGSPKEKDARMRLERLINEQILEKTASLKGPLSEKELVFLSNSVITTASSVTEWKRYLTQARNTLVAGQIERQTTPEAMEQMLGQYFEAGMIDEATVKRLGAGIDALQEV